MNAKLKAKWIKALRSKKYTQYHGGLVGKNRRHLCCIGVGYVVANPKVKLSDLLNMHTHSALAALGVDPIENQELLVTMNDFEKCSFSEIADYIEENL